MRKVLILLIIVIFTAFSSSYHYDQMIEFHESETNKYILRFDTTGLYLLNHTIIDSIGERLYETYSYDSLGYKLSFSSDYGYANYEYSENYDTVSTDAYHYGTNPEATDAFSCDYRKVWNSTNDTAIILDSYPHNIYFTTEIYKGGKLFKRLNYNPSEQNVTYKLEKTYNARGALVEYYTYHKYDPAKQAQVKRETYTYDINGYRTGFYGDRITESIDENNWTSFYGTNSMKLEAGDDCRIEVVTLDTTTLIGKVEVYNGIYPYSYKREHIETHIYEFANLDMLKAGVSIQDGITNLLGGHLLQISQNHIHFSESTPYQIELFSANGRLIRKISGTETNILLNNLGLGNGIYQIRIVQGMDVFTGQIILK